MEGGIMNTNLEAFQSNKCLGRLIETFGKSRAAKILASLTMVICDSEVRKFNKVLADYDNNELNFYFTFPNDVKSTMSYKVDNNGKVSDSEFVIYKLRKRMYTGITYLEMLSKADMLLVKPGLLKKG
jgi:hypothetical protein